MDFKGIQVTLAKVAQALIEGRIDCKTAGRLLVGLQMASKVLWVAEKAKARITAETRRHGEERKVSQICADEHRLSRKASTTKGTPSTPLSQAQCRSGQAKEHEGAPQLRTAAVAKDTGNAASTRNAKIVVIRSAERADAQANSPPEWARPA